MNTNASPLPPQMYATFCGPLDSASVQRLLQKLTTCANGRVKEFHLFFQCEGGEVGAAFALYNFLQAVAVDLTLYNCGRIASMGIIAYLGCRKRTVSKNSYFTIHSIRCGEMSNLPASFLLSMIEEMRIADARYEATVRKHTSIPDSLWTRFHNHEDISLSAEDAVKFGLANEIGEFSPPSGSEIFSI